MAEIIEMPTRVKSKQENNSEQRQNTLVIQLIDIAEAGNKGAVLDYLEKLSEEYRKKPELGVQELVEVMDAYAYFQTNLEAVTYLERIDRWGQESCYFLALGARIINETYEQLAFMIQKKLKENQKNLILSAVNKLREYVKQGAVATVSFLNEKIPNFQIIVNQDNYNDKMADQIVTAFSYQYVTSGKIKGVIKDTNGGWVFGFYFNSDGIESMKEEDIRMEFYTSKDGIGFHLEEDMEVIDLLEGEV